MKHIGCFSGGKDSTALMLWMRENIGVPGQDWTPVFCDTGWEHPITYAYVEEINATVLNSSLTTLRSQKFAKLRELADNKCEKCGMFTVLGDVHHVSGRGAGKRDDRIFVDGEKRLEYICRKCHGGHHVPEKVVPAKPTDAEFNALLGLSLQERP